ncbi:hypothetical protein G4V62_16110 [Bacillaceae bacterium SIJ1]|uniref:hypothetical protein n=1 Tax=Litoribacterium kuwaitense TaxID=1398745 RepID=UPI0013E9D7BF|nr:hypothetical protein [Litoribacterium kuwaitense]NGP46396.1 hypothetical protein [Litoribacterium kuwaitense]
MSKKAVNTGVKIPFILPTYFSSTDVGLSGVYMEVTSLINVYVSAGLVFFIAAAIAFKLQFEKMSYRLDVK